MYTACIAVVDASRARLFTYQRSAEVGGVTESLVENADLVNPARRLRPVDQFSDSRPGSSKMGGLQFGFDDHRDASIEHEDATFSRAITDELFRLVRDNHPRKLIVCASPPMLGELRGARRDIALGDVELDELPRNLVKLAPGDLRQHLASHGLLPPVPARV